MLGWKCERCKPEHYGNASTLNCKACECDPIGSISKQCDNVTGQCLCKERFIGRTCNQCEVSKFFCFFFIKVAIYSDGGYFCIIQPDVCRMDMGMWLLCVKNVSAVQLVQNRKYVTLIQEFVIVWMVWRDFIVIHVKICIMAFQKTAANVSKRLFKHCFLFNLFFIIERLILKCLK